MSTDVHYRPNTAVLEKIRTVKFVAVVGPSGVGKTTLIKRACQQDPDIHLVQTTSNRPLRPGEQNDIDYHQRDEAAIRQRIKRREVVQVAPIVLNRIYCTAPEDYSAAGYSVMPVLAAALPVFRSLPFCSMRTVFVVPPDFQTWLKRMGAHGFSEAERQSRFQEAGYSLRFAAADQQTIFVINQDLEPATEDFLAAVYGKKNQRLDSYQAAARQTVRDILQQLTNA